MADKKKGSENTPHQNRWGKLSIDPKVKNPSSWHTSELQRDGLGGQGGKALPFPPNRDGTQEVYDETSMEKNKAHARRSNKHEGGVDAKMAAYMPRPGDNMPKPFQNHSGMKKPSLVLRFTQKSGGRFYWKDGMNSQREIWVLPTQYGFKATFLYQDTGLVSGYGKTALESVQKLLGRIMYYSVDAACNLPLWTLSKKVVEKKVRLEGQTDVYAVSRYSVPQVSVFKTVHILLAHNPRSPLPSVYQEHFEIRHMRGGYEWEYVSVEPNTDARFCEGDSNGDTKGRFVKHYIVSSLEKAEKLIEHMPDAKVQIETPLNKKHRDSDEFTTGGIDE